MKKKMKKGLMVWIFILPAALWAQNSTGIQFAQGLNWQQVLNKARQERKYVFIDVYATWCGPCQKMDKTVYPDQHIGMAVNDKFISVKVQMDSTASDNPQVKSWYEDAKAIIAKYQVAAFPTLLFLDSEGRLVYRTEGYKNPELFLSLTKQALDVSRIKFYDYLEEWKTHTLDYRLLPQVIAMANELIGDSNLTMEMALEYKDKYLETLSEAELMRPEIFELINNNGRAKLIRSTDKLFALYYNHPAEVDSLKGYAATMVLDVIRKEEITSRLYQNGKPISNRPDWQKIQRTIAKKYSKIDLQKFLLDEKIIFYRTIKDWEKFAELYTTHLKMYPPQTRFIEQGGNFLGDAWGINGNAWDVFENCPNRKVVEQALGWSDQSILVEQPQADYQFLDTRAALLYKLARVKEAIIWEQLCIESLRMLRKLQKQNWEIDDFQIKGYLEVIEKMKKGEPSYPNITWLKK